MMAPLIMWDSSDARKSARAGIGVGEKPGCAAAPPGADWREEVAQMDRQQAEVRRTVAQARLERATCTLKHLRDSALYGFQDDAAYRAALIEIHLAQRELEALRPRGAMAA